MLGPNGALLKASPCDAEAQRTLPTAAVFLSDGRRQLCNGVCYLQASLDGAAYWLADSSCLDEGPANEPEGQSRRMPCTCPAVSASLGCQPPGRAGSPPFPSQPRPLPADCKACDSSATPGLLQVAGAAAQVFYSLQPPEPFPYPVPPGAVLETTGVRAASQGRCYVQVQFWDMKLWLPDHACTQGASSHAQPEGERCNLQSGAVRLLLCLLLHLHLSVLPIQCLSAPVRAAAGVPPVAPPFAGCPACVSTGPGYQTALRAGQYGRIPALDADNPTPGDCGFDAATTGAVAAGERLASDGARAICGGQCFLSVDVAGEKRWLQDGSCAGEQPAVQRKWQGEKVHGAGAWGGCVLRCLILAPSVTAPQSLCIAPRFVLPAVAVVSKDPTPACIKLQFYGARAALLCCKCLVLGNARVVAAPLPHLFPTLLHCHLALPQTLTAASGRASSRACRSSWPRRWRS